MVIFAKGMEKRALGQYSHTNHVEQVTYYVNK